jgi:hypothetical protein
LKLNVIQWIPVNWGISGLECFFPIKQLPQLYKVAHKELKKCMYIRQIEAFCLLSNKNTDFR